MRIFLSAIIAGLLLCPPAFANTTPDPWYQKTVSAFTDAGYIDAKGYPVGIPAARWEFVDLTLRLLGGKVHVPFGEPVFDDIGLVSRFFITFQEGARGKWVRGVLSCAGEHPCYAAPLREVNRAEAAALIVRAFGITRGNDAPSFTDNLPGNWYTDDVSIAASRCILQGDGGTKARRVRPGDSMNRAEMLAMLERVMQKLTYPDCSPVSPSPLPPAMKEFTVVQEIVSTATSSQKTSSSSTTSLSSRSSTSGTPSGNNASTPSAPPASSSSSIPPLFDFSILTNSSSSVSPSSSIEPDPGYPELITSLQQNISQFYGLIGQARTADGATSLQVLTVLRSQMDLLNQLYPYIVYGRTRTLNPDEWSVVYSLESSIRAGFAAAPR